MKSASVKHMPLLTALLLTPLTALHAEDGPSTQNGDTALMLAGDWVPEDSHRIDYEKLPRVKAEHAIISDVRDHAGTRVHQHAYLAHHDGRFWAMWSDGPGGPRAGVTPEQHRNIVPGHDMPGTRNSFATSLDGLHWSEPADLTGPPRKKGFGWIARGLWKRDGQLLALISHFNAPGYAGLGLSLEAFRWNGMRWVAHGTVLDDSMNNFPPKRLPSGQWMMTRRDHQRQVSVMIGGTKAFDNWRINPLAAYDGSGRPEEPYWYILPDGKTIVGLIRDNGGSKFLLRTFSQDNGKTLYAAVELIVPDLGNRASFSLATASGAERVVIGIDENGSLTAGLYKETVTGLKLEPGIRHSLLIRLHSHREKPDKLFIQLGSPDELPNESKNWTLSNTKGSSAANLSRVVLHSDANGSAGFTKVRVAPTREALAKAKVASTSQ